MRRILVAAEEDIDPDMVARMERPLGAGRKALEQAMGGRGVRYVRVLSAGQCWSRLGSQMNTPGRRVSCRVALAKPDCIQAFTIAERSLS